MKFRKVKSLMLSGVIIANDWLSDDLIMIRDGTSRIYLRASETRRLHAWLGKALPPKRKRK